MNYCCIKCFNTIAVSIVSGVLVLKIPETELTNCMGLRIRIMQDIPAGITADMPVAIKSGTQSAYTMLNPCCANNVYADQVRKCGFYIVRFGSDTNCFILKGGWRLCQTAHIFDKHVIITKTTNKKVEVEKNE